MPNYNYDVMSLLAGSLDQADIVLAVGVLLKRDWITSDPADTKAPILRTS